MRQLIEALKKIQVSKYLELSGPAAKHYTVLNASSPSVGIPYWFCEMAKSMGMDREPALVVFAPERRVGDSGLCEYVYEVPDDHGGFSKKLTEIFKIADKKIGKIEKPRFAVAPGLDNWLPEHDCTHYTGGF